MKACPGHYFQKVMSWTNEDPIRRHYYDSSANEGIGFYAEEMMLQAGLFDDSPRTREIIYNFMRFRALRVEVDVKLSTGEFTIEQAADYFMKTVPLDRATAMEDATFYASVPGVGISYQTGKLQIMKLLAEARLAQGRQIQLARFHDFVWKNGNVPSPCCATNTWARRTRSKPCNIEVTARLRSSPPSTHWNSRWPATKPDSARQAKESPSPRTSWAAPIPGELFPAGLHSARRLCLSWWMR